MTRTRPPLTVLRGGRDDDGWRDDGSRWCLHCMLECEWSPNAEHWVHTENRNVVCPTDPDSRLVLAPEGMTGRM